MYRVLTIDPFEFTLETDGSGLWSKEAKKVQSRRITLEYEDIKDARFGYLYGELRVYFDTTTWDTQEDGLIYTDDQFMDDLKGCLDVTGLDDADVSYSEQGMQGKDYVSCDVGENFITSWNFKQWSESELPGN